MVLERTSENPTLRRGSSPVGDAHAIQGGGEPTGTDIEFAAESFLIGQACGYELGNLFDPAHTLVCFVEKRFLPKLA